jgi:hypothetical protein
VQSESKAVAAGKLDAEPSESQAEAAGLVAESKAVAAGKLAAVPSESKAEAAGEHPTGQHPTGQLVAGYMMPMTKILPPVAATTSFLRVLATILEAAAAAAVAAARKHSMEMAVSLECRVSRQPLQQAFSA